MFDILHRIGIHNAPPPRVYGALTSIDKLSSWWTRDTKGRSEVGSVISFRFGERGFFDMKVLELEPARRVVWEVVAGPEEWIGTRVIWDLTPEGEGTTLRFKHQGWREPVDFMNHCSTKWASFLFSLKAQLENGKGAPFPDDFLISIDFD